MKKVLKAIIFPLLYWSGCWLLVRWVTRRKARILMYHGIVPRDIAVWTQLPLTQFEEHIRHLAKWYRPLKLTEFVDNKKRAGSLGKFPAIVTFDDGMKSNLTLASPVLAKYQVPAIVFVTTSLVDGQSRFAGMIWTDYIRGLVRSTSLNRLDLSDLGLATFDLSSQSARLESEQDIGRALKKVGETRRVELIDTIAGRLGGEIRPEYAEAVLGMTWDELRTLDRSGQMEIGAHTVNHAILSTLLIEEAEREMSQSQTLLERELKHPVRHFAYPNGTPADFGREHMKIAEKYFDSAVSTIEGLVAPDDGNYDLKRINIGNDMSLLEFKLRLSGTLELLGI